VSKGRDGDDRDQDRGTEKCSWRILLEQTSRSLSFGKSNELCGELLSRVERLITRKRAATKAEAAKDEVVAKYKKVLLKVGVVFVSFFVSHRVTCAKSNIYL